MPPAAERPSRLQGRGIRVDPRSQDAAGRWSRILALCRDLGTGYEDMVDADSVGIEATGAAGQIEAGSDRARSHCVGVDDQDVCMRPFGQDAAVPEAVEAGRRPRQMVDRLFELE